MKRTSGLFAITLIVLASGCASTHHYYSGSGSQTYRVGDGTAYGSMRVSASSSGVRVAPSLRYRFPAKRSRP